MMDLAKLRILTFSGWGQMPDALDCVIPAQVRCIQNMAYYPLTDKEAVLKELREQAPQADVVIGWSLGGKLAARAVAGGILAPKLLVLLATPFQYLPDGGIEKVVRGKSYRNFYDAFKTDADVARTAFTHYIAAGDASKDRVLKRLTLDTRHDREWLNWLISMKFGSDGMDLSHMPRTLIVHGKNDAIIDLRQPQLYKEHIADCRMELFEGCGHAPHLHASERIAGFIGEELAAIG